MGQVKVTEKAMTEDNISPGTARGEMPSLDYLIKFNFNTVKSSAANEHDAKSSHGDPNVDDQNKQLCPSS